MTGSSFERFVGIDWSGAREEFQRGIQVAEFRRGNACPKIVSPPSGMYWGRQSVLKYVSSLQGPRTLVGIDFAFSVPWDRSCGALPQCIEGLPNVYALWEFIDTLCRNEPFFYAGPVWRRDDSPLRSLVLCAGHRGSEFSNHRLRLTELRAKPRPETIYKVIGAKTVGAGSFAGMRVLHALGALGDKRVAIWPFAHIGAAHTVILEVYPSAFYRMAGRRRPNVSNDSPKAIKQTVRAVLRHFDATEPCNVAGLSGDQFDALVTAVALASISPQRATFCVPENLKRIVSFEGWIFGIPFGAAA
jgi:hypothetical protein